jgi:hypothetical protein
MAAPIEREREGLDSMAAYVPDHLAAFARGPLAAPVTGAWRYAKEGDRLIDQASGSSFSVVEADQPQDAGHWIRAGYLWLPRVDDFIGFDGRIGGALGTDFCLMGNNRDGWEGGYFSPSGLYTACPIPLILPDPLTALFVALAHLSRIEDVQVISILTGAGIKVKVDNEAVKE